MKKIVLILALMAPVMGGCYDYKQARYNTEEAQHRRSLDSIMEIYDAKCAAKSFAAQTGQRNDDYCDGLREAYWKIEANRQREGFEK